MASRIIAKILQKWNRSPRFINTYGRVRTIKCPSGYNDEGLFEEIRIAMEEAGVTGVRMRIQDPPGPGCPNVIINIPIEFCGRCKKTGKG